MARWPWQQTESAADAADESAAQVEQLAVLVRGGIPLARARSYLDADPLAGESDAARTLHAAVRVAERAGAPLAGVLDAVAGSLRDTADLHRSLEVALAGPKATARMVTLLPLLGPLMAWAFGLDPLGALFGNVVGLAALAIGVLLLVVSARWTRAIVRRASRLDRSAGLEPLLLAVALRAGMSVPDARQLVARELRAAGLDGSDEAVAGRKRERGEIERSVHLSERAGVPVRALLEAQARSSRIRATRDAEANAARASIQLAVPLGACVLPAFVCLGVVPFILATLASVSGSG